jgi:Ala-tRNA(Pro) deacylase
MSIPKTVQNYLKENSIKYDILHHAYTSTSMGTAQSSGISGEAIAKSVVLEDDDGYIMAVIPATHHIELGQLGHQLHRHLGLATERELSELFNDCDLGAIPAIGQAYDMDVVVEDSLLNRADIYFESGDHTDLIHITGQEFQRIMNNVHHGRFSRHT